jgi:hypothetical protein
MIASCKYILPFLLLIGLLKIGVYLGWYIIEAVWQLPGSLLIRSITCCPFPSANLL